MFTVACSNPSLVGDQVTYTVAAGVYTSNVSQVDADSKAQADIDANGQNYANANGGCKASITATNIGIAGDVMRVLTLGMLKFITNRGNIKVVPIQILVRWLSL